MSSKSISLIDKLTDFVVENMPQYKERRQEIKACLIAHLKYGTLDFHIDSKGIAFVMRYNISDDVVSVLDLAIRKDLRSKQTLKWIILSSWVKNPLMKKFKFQRLNKYPNRSERAYGINEFIGGI